MSTADVPSGASVPPTDWAARADDAARTVTSMFGQRLLFLPGTHIAAVVRPSSQLRILLPPWHYWWQAHYLDCLVDTGRRELERSRRFDGDGRPSAGKLASRLVTGIRLRNLLSFVNNYYDDMAWLALATLRLEKLAEDSCRARPQRHAKALRMLELEFDSASTDHLGGGTFWSIKRDFKNTPATAPVALQYARTGHPAKAQALLDWLAAKLFDPSLGLYLDGLRIRPDGSEELDQAIYTYNQGPVLGALLELGGRPNLDRAAALVDAVARRLTRPVPPAHRTAAGTAAGTASGTAPATETAVLRCEGTGDGGLFTGILARYLALAATDARLPLTSRSTASALVTNTAEALWAGRRVVRREEELAKRSGGLVFSVQPDSPAAQTHPPGAAVELSTQLQGWMIMEAAAAVTTSSTHSL